MKGFNTDLLAIFNEDLTPRRDYNSEDMALTFNEMKNLEAKEIMVNLRLQKLRNEQKELAEAKKNFYDLFNMAPVPYIIIDDKASISNLNQMATELLHGESDNLLHGSFLKFVDQKSLLGFFYFIKQLKQKRSFQEIELLMLTCEKTTFHGKLRGLYLPGEGKRLGQVWVIITDISAQKEREGTLTEAKQQSNDATLIKSKLISSMSHDIRSALNGILGLCQVLKGHNVPPAELHSFLSIIEEGGKTIKEIVDNLSVQSKLEAGELSLNEGEFYLSQLMASLESRFQFEAESRSCVISSEVDPAIQDQRLGDEHYIKRVLSNLINNALKYAGDGGAILLKVEKQKDHLLFSVQDFGEGIPESFGEELFLEYQQVDKENQKDGMGLGLSICHQLVSLMGGTIWFESQLGMGTTFYFEIPDRVIEDPNILTDPEQCISKVICWPPMNALLVQGDTLSEQILEGLLTPLDISIENVCDARSVIQRLSKMDTFFDFIILDLKMPVEQGYDTLTAIRGMELEMGLTSIPLVVNSSHATPQEVEKVLGMGADYFLPKPVIKKDLEQIVEQIVSLKFPTWSR